MGIPTNQAAVSSTRASLHGTRPFGLLVVATFQLLVLSPVLAEEPSAVKPALHAEARVERRILALRAADATRSTTELHVDRVLGQVLSEMGFIVNVSPLPFRDAQLAIGCSGGLLECGGRVAATLESEQLSVSSLREQDEDTAYLELYLFAPGHERADASELPLDSPTALEQRVRELARTVYGEVAPEPRVALAKQTSSEPAAPPPLPSAARPAPEPATPPTSRPRPQEPVNPVVRTIGWSAATAGAALLLGGVAMSVAAGRSSDAYARQEIHDKDDADRALASYARAEHQSDTARVLFGTGGAVLIAGSAFLLWEYLVPERRDRTLRVAALPVLGGALVSMSYRSERRGW
jgi:hypothetical protein